MGHEGRIAKNMQTDQDVDEFIRLVRLAHVYIVCAYDPAPEIDAISEIGKHCEVTRTLESKEELKQFALPDTLMEALLQTIADVREVEKEVPIAA